MTPAMIAEIAYAQYSIHSNNKNVRGETLPLWSELDKPNQEAWIAGTQAVRTLKLADLDDKPIVEAFVRLAAVMGGSYETEGAGATKDARIEVMLIDQAIEAIRSSGMVAA